MILTRQAILRYIASGNIVFSGDRSQVQENSINVRLGSEMWTCSRDAGVIDLHEPRHFDSVVADRGVFFLKPGRVYIGTTLERVGTSLKGDGRAIVPEMRARSTTGRHGLTVALCAGMGDVGYQGRWALEIVNNNKLPVMIREGTEIAQVVFHAATTVYPEDGYGGEGRYQKEDGSIQFLPKVFDKP